MGSVVNFKDAQPVRKSLLEQLHSAGAFYDVLVADNLFTNPLSGAVEATGKKTLVNGTTGEPISIMSDEYTVIRNKDIFEQFDGVLANSGIDLTDAFTRVRVGNNGGKCMVEYVFPSTTATPAKGDNIALSVTCVNSFDGTTGFHMYTGFYRFKCLNGMVWGSDIATYNKRHSRGVSISDAAQVVGTGLKVWMENKDTFIAQTKQAVTEEQVWSCLSTLAKFDDYKVANSYVDYKKYVLPHMQRVTSLEKYYRVWEDYALEMGKTQWALSNTMTHIATHGVGNKEPEISTKLQKFKEVNKLLQSINIGVRAA